MNKLFIILLVSILNFTSLLSQDSTLKSYFGINFGFGYNIHNADFRRIPDCPSCSPGYRGGNGLGFDLGLVYDYKLTSRLFISGRVLYSDISGELTRIEKTTIILNTPTDGEFTHYLDSKISITGIEPHLKYNPFKDLFINIGFNFSSILNKEYSQVEKITKPDDFGTFLDENGNNTFSRERNNYSGTLESANSIYFAPFLSLSYQLPLNFKRTLILEPELKYTYGLTNIIDDEIVPTWTINRVIAGVSIKYDKVKYEEKFEHIKNIDTIKIEKGLISSYEFKVGKANIVTKHLLSNNQKITEEIYNRTDTLFIPIKDKIDGKLIVVGIDENGNEVSNQIFQVNEFVSNRMDPILNYVFFNENSFNLPSRYINIELKEANSFNINNLYRDSILQIYYNVLNIVGKRMRDNPDANLTLIGCNSDYDKEKGNLELSEKRAKTIRDYLVNIWSIENRRIKIEKRNLPEKPSTPITENEKIEENRRVELYSDNPKILEPIFIEKIDRKSNPPIVRFKVKIQSDVELDKWELIAFQDSIKNKNYFKYENKEFIKVIDWKLSDNQKITPSLNESLKSKLIINDVKGNLSTVNGNDLKIKINSIKDNKNGNGRTESEDDDYQYESYSLILFDFDKANIEKANLEVINFIKRRIKSNSEIEIFAYTDKTGNLEYNQNLAEQRGIAVRNSLGSKNSIVKSIGSSILLFNNDLPEGRFYCRTVKINIKTKIQ